MERLGVLLGTLLALMAAAPAEAAAPQVILVYGPLLDEPVYLTEWLDNFWLIVGEEGGETRERLDGRPYLDLALFWGDRWQQYAGPDGDVQRLRPEQASQRGRFYPAIGDAPAVVTLEALVPGSWVDAAASLGTAHLVRTVRPQGLDALAGHGVPIRVEPTALRGSAPPAGSPTPLGPVLATLAVTFAGIWWTLRRAWPDVATPPTAG